MTAIMMIVVISVFGSTRTAVIQYDSLAECEKDKTAAMIRTLEIFPQKNGTKRSTIGIACIEPVVVEHV